MAIWATIWVTCDTARLVGATCDGRAPRLAACALAPLARCVPRWPRAPARWTAFLRPQTLLPDAGPCGSDGARGRRRDRATRRWRRGGERAARARREVSARRLLSSSVVMTRSREVRSPSSPVKLRPRGGWCPPNSSHSVRNYNRTATMRDVARADADHVTVKTEMLQLRLMEKKRDLVRRDEYRRTDRPEWLAPC